MKRSLLTFVLFLLLINLSYAQVNYRISAGPVLSNVNSSNDFFNNEFKNSFNLGFIASGKVIARSQSQLQLYAGIGIGNQGSELKFLNNGFWDIDGNPVEDSPLFDGVEQITNKSKIFMAEIPIGINYFFFKSSKGLFMDAGLTPTFSMTYFSITVKDFEDGTKERKVQDVSDPFNGLNRFNLNTKLGLGYQFSKFRNLRVLVFGETQTFNFLKDTPNTSRFYRTGISIGMQL